MENIEKASRETATITFIISCATFYGWVLIRSRTPIILLEFITGISTNPLVILLLLNIFLLIIGCFMESIAALGILVPTVTPLILKVGIDPLHFGLVMILNLMIGLLTPPFGMNLFILNKITGIPSTRIARACLPFLSPFLLPSSRSPSSHRLSLFCQTCCWDQGKGGKHNEHFKEDLSL